MKTNKKKEASIKQQAIAKMKPYVDAYIKSIAKIMEEHDLWRPTDNDSLEKMLKKKRRNSDLAALGILEALVDPPSYASPLKAEKIFMQYDLCTHNEMVEMQELENAGRI